MTTFLLKRCLRSPLSGVSSPVYKTRSRVRGRALYTAMTDVALVLVLSGAPSVRLAALEAIATADADARYALRKAF